jgi:hypothetical protein
MRAVLGSVIVLACLVFGEVAFAQGGCSATCRRYNAECQRQLGVAVAQAGRACAGNATCESARRRQQRAYANACNTSYRQCLRNCGGR